MSNLKDRMYNHEVNPPANSWDRIADALDDSELQNKFPSRLYNMELTPPAAIWEKINDKLEANAGKVTPVRKLVPFFRYAAAAVLIAAVVFGISRFGFNKDETEDFSSNTLPLKDSNPGIAKPADTGNATASEEIQTSGENDLPVKRINIKARAVNRETKPNISRAALIQSVNVDNNLFQSIYAYTDHVPDIADRYIMLMTPDGKLIRMSKKWGDLLCCVSGEEQDADCRNQIKKWQEKIAASSLAPAPGNFMDILGLVNSLQETNGL